MTAPRGCGYLPVHKVSRVWALTMDRKGRCKTMTGRRVLPPVQELQAMRERNMTLREIAERIFDATGEKVTPSAISAQLSRAGLSMEQTRYKELIPWRVLMAHQKHYHVRMLRLEARRRAGNMLDASQVRRLDGWIAELKEKNAVIHYNPNKEPGFHAVPARPGIDTDLIRVPDDLVD